MQTVLVTGGNGLIGQHICSGLLKKGFAVISVDNKDNDYNTGKLNYTFIQADIKDKNQIGEIFEKNKIDILVHAACTVDNDWGPIVSETQISESKICDGYLYRYAMEAEVQKVIMLSTDQVYEFQKTREPIREDNDLKPVTNYANIKLASENALIAEYKQHRDTICCVARFVPVYTHKFTDNLIAKITDPKDGMKFVYGKGQYGFQLCCVHNLVDFILCYAKNAEETKYSGVYNVADNLLTSAADIISFMRENYHLGAVVQKTPGGAISKLKGLFGNGKDEKMNYRYLDLAKLENNNALDTTKAAKFVNFRWDIHNTK